MTATVAIGLVAAVVSCCIALPQAWRMCRTGSTDGVSAGTWAITLFEEVLWLVWAVMAREWVAVIPALINSPLCILILMRLWRARRHKTAAPTDATVITPMVIDHPDVIDLNAYRASLAASPAYADG